MELNTTLNDSWMQYLWTRSDAESFVVVGEPEEDLLASHLPAFSATRIQLAWRAHKNAISATKVQTACRARKILLSATKIQTASIQNVGAAVTGIWPPQLNHRPRLRGTGVLNMSLKSYKFTA